jgi:hypothetical protein
VHASAIVESIHPRCSAPNDQLIAARHIATYTKVYCRTARDNEDFPGGDRPRGPPKQTGSYPNPAPGFGRKSIAPLDDRPAGEHKVGRCPYPRSS